MLDIIDNKLIKKSSKLKLNLEYKNLKIKKSINKKIRKIKYK